MLLWPLRLFRCLWICFAWYSGHRGFSDAYRFVLHAALAIGAFQMLMDFVLHAALAISAFQIPSPSGLFVVDAALVIGLCSCLLICFPCCSGHLWILQMLIGFVCLPFLSLRSWRCLLFCLFRPLFMSTSAKICVVCHDNFDIYFVLYSALTTCLYYVRICSAFCIYILHSSCKLACLLSPF